MPTNYVVDTHALVWYLEDNDRLGDRAGQVMDDPASRLLVPIIALAEACWIVEHHRCSIRSVPVLVADVVSDPRITIIPLDGRILDHYLTIPGDMEMHDRLIVATAMELATPGETVAILTADQSIQSSELVSVVW